MVADHQGGRDQGRIGIVRPKGHAIGSRAAWPAGKLTTGRPPSWALPSQMVTVPQVRAFSGRIESGGIPKCGLVSESSSLIRILGEPMAKPYSRDLRMRVVEAVEDGASRREVAELFGISPSVVVIWMQRWTQTGSVEAKLTLRPQVDGGARATCDRFVMVAGLAPSRSGSGMATIRFRLAGRAGPRA
jgi:hypothetical protein